MSNNVQSARKGERCFVINQAQIDCFCSTRLKFNKYPAHENNVIGFITLKKEGVKAEKQR